MKAIEMTGVDYYHSQDDVHTLKRLVEMLPPNPVIVNIGVAFGTSVLAMLEARPDAYVFAIDVEAELPARKNLAGYEGRMAFIVGRSQDVGAGWPYPVDMVFVDGSHLREDIEADATAWLPKLKLNGIIAFDDYAKPICPEVKPAVDAVMKGYLQILQVDDIVAFWINP